MKVLVVEDDSTTRLMLSILLRRSDIACDLAADGFEAVRAWETGQYDLILMDVQMPDLDGLEATQRIREKERGGRRTVIIAMTAHLLPEDAEQCRHAGMDDLIPKPINFDQLLALIKRYR